MLYARRRLLYHLVADSVTSLGWCLSCSLLLQASLLTAVCRSVLRSFWLPALLRPVTGNRDCSAAIINSLAPYNRDPLMYFLMPLRIPYPLSSDRLPRGLQAESPYDFHFLHRAKGPLQSPPHWSWLGLNTESLFLLLEELSVARHLHLMLLKRSLQAMAGLWKTDWFSDPEVTGSLTLFFVQCVWRIDKNKHRSGTACFGRHWVDGVEPQQLAQV